MDAVEDVKNRLSVEDVISRYVELKRAGRNFKGLSPFNNEKTASFMVSPDKQIWHDFSSGKGGNMFSFVMEMEGVDFRGALELLARQAGVDLSQYQRSDSGRGKQRERLGEVLELAAKFYQIHFSKNKTALEYILKTRKFSKTTALEFKIGYSPSSGKSLTKFLLGKGYSAQELKSAGLATQRGGSAGQQISDMFRGRIMIPLQDPFGKVIGFTARLLNESRPLASGAPKYINTPATLLYDKSRHVFGLHLAKEAIRKSNFAVVVEGNLDVIASHQAGIRQVVATAGTAITDQHLKVISRLTDDVRLAFDQDSAGLAAAERSIPIASKANVSLSIITVTEGKDPDELIQKDPALWQRAIEAPQYAVDWLIEQYLAKLDLTSAKGKREFTDILLKVVKALDDSVEQDHYITRLSKLLDISAEALRAKLARTDTTNRPKTLKHVTPPSKTADKSVQELVKAQNHFLAIMLVQPGLRMYVKLLDETILPGESAQKLLVFFKENPKFIYNETAKIPTGTREYCNILLLLYEELYQSLELLDLRYEAAQLQARLIQQYVKSQKTKLASAMRETGATSKLLNRAKELDLLLNQVKEKING